MVTNIAGKPGHRSVRGQKTGRLERRFFVRPTGRVIKGHIREVVLSVKEIGTDCARDGKWDEHQQDQCSPAEKERDQYEEGHVKNERDDAIGMFFGFLQRGKYAHATQEHEDVTKQNRQWMTHEEIFGALLGGRLEELCLGHDRK